MLQPFNFPRYPVFDRDFMFNVEELTPLEAISRVAEVVNKVIEQVNTWQDQLDDREKSIDITNKRKLSPTGNFTGFLAGIAVLTVIQMMYDNRDKIQYLADQFSDGQTGLVIDGGFFEDTAIHKNYDGGWF